MVLDHLRELDDRFGKSGFGHPPHRNLASIEGTNVPTDRHGMSTVLNERPHNPDQGVFFEDHVGVGYHDVWKCRGVDSGVESVALAAILFVNDSQRDRQARLINGPNVGMLELWPNRKVDPAKLERLDEPIERVIGRSVIDDHQLVSRVRQDRARPHRLDDPGRLVVSGNNERHGRG